MDDEGDLLIEHLYTVGALQDDDDNVQTPPEGHATWQTYWYSRGMRWRQMPEIDADRQQFLAERRAVKPVIRQGVYPFRGINLTRADVEWLLETHESQGIQGPVWWDDERDKPEAERRIGLDLRGANLQEADLSGLPLAGLVGSLSNWVRDYVPNSQWTEAQVILADAKLSHAHLEHAVLRGVHLEHVTLSSGHLDGADLGDGHLERALMDEAHLEGANLQAVHLEGAFLLGTHLEGADLSAAHLEGTDLRHVHLEGANLRDAQLRGTRVGRDDLLRLRQYAEDFPERLPGANLREAFFDSASNLRNAAFGALYQEGTHLADVRWGDANLAVVDWGQVAMLGEEWVAWDWKPSDYEEVEWKKLLRKDAKAKKRDARQAAFEEAVRANRQLATALRGQGMNEQADRFAYRAQVCQRQVLRLQRHALRFLGSWFLDRVAGYGYRPLRSLLTYVLVVLAFAVVYYLLGNNVQPPMSIHGAIVFSITSFHGRGFSPGEQVALENPITTLAAIEAIIGLLIEITFIATFTQRFFAR